LFSCIGYTASNGRRLIKDELGEVGNWGIRTVRQYCLRIKMEGLEENHRNSVRITSLRFEIRNQILVNVK
jgi:hypothetical protein